MMRLFFLWFIFLPSLVYAQQTGTGSLNVFSEQGDAFFLFLDGKKQNENAVSSIRVEGLSALAYEVKLVFEKPEIAPIQKKNVYISDGDDVLMDAYYRISRTSSIPKWRFYAMNPSGISTKNDNVLVIKPNENISNVPDSIQNPKPVLVKDIPALPSKEEQVKITTATPESAVENPVSKSVSTVKKENQKTIPEKNQSAANKNVAVKPFTIREPENWVCRNEWPMWKVDYSNAKKDIAEAKTDQIKLEKAKALVNKNCLSSDQVAEIGSLFLMENTKLDFAKFAFNHTIDIRNYQKVNGIFSTPGSKKALNNFISNL